MPKSATNRRMIARSIHWDIFQFQMMWRRRSILVITVVLSWASLVSAQTPTPTSEPFQWFQMQLLVSPVPTHTPPFTPTSSIFTATPTRTINPNTRTPTVTPPPTPIRSPSNTPGAGLKWFAMVERTGTYPPTGTPPNTPTPTPTAIGGGTATPSITRGIPTGTPTVSPQPTSTAPTPTITVTVTQTPRETPTPFPTVTPENTNTPTNTQTVTPTPEHCCDCINGICQPPDGQGNCPEGCVPGCNGLVPCVCVSLPTPTPT